MSHKQHLPLVGIDKASFYTSHYFLDLKTLAEARGNDPDKFYIGLGQQKMAVCPPDEDIVTMAANAADRILDANDRDQVTTLLFATESGIDQSKSAGIFTHQLLKLNRRCRVVELKQACYAGTAGLQMALAMLRQNPQQKILLIASDIARYGLNTTGESSQGGGAIALLLTANPRLIAIDPECGFCTEDAMDFWRPNYRDEALVEGKYSCDLYLRLLKETWQHYQEQSENDYLAHDYFCYHTPFPRLAEKAHQKLKIASGHRDTTAERLQQSLGHSLTYAKMIGNCYTASLFIGLLSQLENCSDNLAGKRFGFYSYGSGCTAEFFSGIVQPQYKDVLFTQAHRSMLSKRVELDEAGYEAFYKFKFPTDGSRFIVPKHETGRFRLCTLDQHKRVYEQVRQQAKSQTDHSLEDNIIELAHAKPA